MCTFVILNRVHPDYPVIVGANRDEVYSRDATAPKVVRHFPRTIAGVDVDKGGSWLGANEFGIVAGLTNHPDEVAPIAGLESRGQIVVDALARENVADIRSMLMLLDTGRYKSFNLLYGDSDTLEVAYGRRHNPGVAFATVPRGISVLVNDRLNAAGSPKVQRVRALAEDLPSQPWDELIVSLQHVLSDHARPESPPEAVNAFDGRLPADFLVELQAVCVHTPMYGTRSASVIALKTGIVAHHLYADGPPCQHDLEPLTLW